MKSSEILGAIIKAKLGIADRLISRLPENVKPLVREAEKAVLTVFRDELSCYLQKETREVKDNGLKKVEVD